MGVSDYKKTIILAFFRLEKQLAVKIRRRKNFEKKIFIKKFWGVSKTRRLTRRRKRRCCVKGGGNCGGGGKLQGRTRRFSAAESGIKVNKFHYARSRASKFKSSYTRSQQLLQVLQVIRQLFFTCAWV